MKLPDFFESSHPLIESLQDQSDEQLLQDFQTQPSQGRFFIAIFCRYAPLTYALLSQKAGSSLQVEYLFAKAWRNLFFELRALDFHSSSSSPGLTLQDWIFEKIAVSIHTDPVPSIEEVPYSLATAPFPLWCYLQIALDQLPPRPRLLLVLTYLFHWSAHKIVSFLAAEGEELAPAQLDRELIEASDGLLAAIPEDIQEIYLTPETVKA
ncbi:sigma-70 family RNA polymerase sigma factor [Lyngbya confervoides]|uniref:Sigma-70 family RNA polymerase sigma factor n=1 Tax=Lyngbya confervoides BDU141951 TaxID=1574623 RepID=A0ABD4SZ94_9CYAN|nr:sigma-70 family RNA polymerase sigma factor [Lyngbya confervoides]MCM1981665.1 sigma-70 family RNA polymerase sigma factor [Lyngbya confervoides BDU141951]